MPFALPGQEAAPKQPQCKDQAECTLYDAILKDNNAKSRLEKLQQWEKQYPSTEFLKVRRTLLITTYAGAGQPKEAVGVAKQALAEDPKDFNALYYTMFLTQSLYGVSQQPAVLDDGEKASKALLASIDTPPPGVAADQWAKVRPDVEVLSHTTLGFIGMQRKTWDGAEAELKKALQLNPNNSGVDYMLGFTLASKKENSAALFYYARAAAYDGPGSLAAQQRQGVQTQVQQMYTAYHGKADGLTDLLAKAKAEPNPPEGFHIPSKGELAKASAEAEAADAEKFAKEHPELALWKNIKTQLTGTDGDNYFNSGMKGAKLPTLRGKVVKLEPENRPKTLVLALENGTTGDATLKFEMALAGKVEAGTELTFEGVPDSYTANPFMVVFSVDKEDLHGWTGKNAPPVRRPAAKKSSAQK
ncbi:MAG: tetratricopeptide repeat protein [Acidobacteriia bacterium]|nr:tetratricopeptide repeat protein [Terriglobia bacterium]